jgi:ssDNA-binding Zn-finger/Zn-ribbon topoisomerase 1
MVNCPECGKPLNKKKKNKSKYFCDNDNCSVIFVLYPDKPSLTEIKREPKLA